MVFQQNINNGRSSIPFTWNHRDSRVKESGSKENGLTHSSSPYHDELNEKKYRNSDREGEVYHTPCMDGNDDDGLFTDLA